MLCKPFSGRYLVPQEKTHGGHTRKVSGRYATLQCEFVKLCHAFTRVLV